MMLSPLADALARAGASLLCLSDAVRDALSPQLGEPAHVAAAPDEDALLDLLVKLHPPRLFVAADMQAP
jgi:hypothetical protein